MEVFLTLLVDGDRNTNGGNESPLNKIGGRKQKKGGNGNLVEHD